MFKGSSKSKGVFRTQVSIYDSAFLWMHLAAYYFCNKIFIADVRLGCILASEKLEFSKWS